VGNSALRAGQPKAAGLHKPLGLPTASNGVSGFFIRRSAPLSLAFVPELLAFGQRQLNFYFAVLEVHADGNQGQSLLLRFADQLADFFLVHEQLPGPQGRVVMNVAVLVGTDVGIEQPEFALFHQAVGIFKVSQAAPN